jgi:hypothetical protein
MPRWVAAVVAFGVAGSAGAGHADNKVVRAWLERARADLAAAALANVPPAVPPVPIKVTWRAKRIASINLGAPLLALVGGDLDGDKRAELYAVTERDVVAFDVAKKVTERARAALPDDVPAIRPRDQVATAYIDRAGKPELRVMTSSRAHGARYALDGKGLRELGQLDQFPMCAGKTAALVPGRNHFGTVEAPVYGLRCRDDLVDRAGTPLAVTAELGAGGALAVTITPRATAEGTASVYTGAPVEVPAVGYAYEVADVDRDGTVDLITAGAGAPGDRDAIKVLAIDGATVAKKPKYRKAFTGGVVAIAVADVDGDGADEVIGAVRLPGSTKVDLWQLNP